MKKTWMIVLLALVGSVAQAGQRVSVAELNVNGKKVLITAEAPVKNGGGIAFKNARAEVNGQTLRIATRSLYQAWAEGSICNDLEFKNLYLGSETASDQKALDMVTGEEVSSDNKPLVSNIVCMENPY